jgi:hypothetical protein
MRFKVGDIIITKSGDKLEVICIKNSGTESYKLKTLSYNQRSEYKESRIVQISIGNVDENCELDLESMRDKKLKDLGI